MKSAKSLLESNPKWTTNASFDALCDVTGRSFAGSETSPEEPVMSYAFRGIVPPEKGHPERKDAYKFIMSFPIQANNRRNAIHFGHSNSNEKGDDDNKRKVSTPSSLQSMAIIRECDPATEFSKQNLWDKFISKAGPIWLYIQAMIKKTLPSVFLDSKTMQLMEERGVIVDTNLQNWHKVHGPQTKHIYVCIIATDPNFQGRGYGTQLMNQISEIADADGQACYLECGGDKNRSFYEKFGYKVVREPLLKDDKDGTEQVVYIMVRPAKVS